MVKILLKSESKIRHLDKEELSRHLGLEYLPSLFFPTDRILSKVRKQSRVAMRKKELSMREKWLGVRFQKELLAGYEPEISIRWIDEFLGYGIFAEREIPSGAFIGEYTGLIRKRRRRADRKNDYCFEYTIGDWVYNPFIIDAKEMGNFTRFINHSETPNVESLSVFADGVMHIIFVAQKSIAQGSQLCYHYGDYFWKKRRNTPIRAIR